MSYSLERQSQSKIKILRGVAVILDADLAALYGVETKQLNQAVKRNETRFPEDFCFVLTKDEWHNLRSQIVTSSSHGGRRYPPRAFTEHGVTMIASLLNSEMAIDMSIMVVREFVRMRRDASEYAALVKKIDALELKMGSELSDVWKVIKAMLDSPPKPPRPIGFRQVKERRK
ncbi:MAG TPA: ORF6N domain-containing protein [Fimbriimonas sp.]|nr:ORF6N domain-containing protein [Fimbriimonas sp.]